MVCSAEKDIECAQKIRKMKYFDCQNISPCSGLIMAKTKTKPVEISEMSKSLYNWNNNMNFKWLYTNSGTLVWKLYNRKAYLLKL